MKILVCGGAGYIGSHTCVSLIESGYVPVILDNFCNSSPQVLDRLAAITGHAIQCINIDIRDYERLKNVFANDAFGAVIHFAALKAVGESCEDPVSYFDNNISGTISLLRAMRDSKVNRLVFSSSATVYGTPKEVPVTESADLAVTNPYGRTKLVMEQLIGDICAAHPEFHAALLRYFNPIGAHPSGAIGEDPRGYPNNIMPFITQVAVGKLEKLRIFGNDYPTRDGTGVRDYIHVVDLAEAHVSALKTVLDQERSVTVNLGTGRGYSVLELVAAMAQVCGREIPYEIAPRRPGDVAEIYADPALAEELLGWRAKRGLHEMCVDAWRWQSENPNGYADN